MASNSTFNALIEKIRTAIYGKDVREAIANSIEICYDSASGDVALDAADLANAAAANADTISQNISSRLSDLDDGLATLDSIVKISDTQPTETANKIWVQPQDDTEYKIPTFAAYEALWSRVQDFADTYQQGHGGVVSIAENAAYSNPENALEREFVITYSDGTTATIHLQDGATGATGPVDQISSTAIWYHAGVMNNGNLVQTPPESGWTNTIPTIDSGGYLWARTVVTYTSGAQAYIYALSRMGTDGSGAVNSVAIGSSGAALTGDIVLPVDSSPAANSGNLMTSGGIYLALQNATVSPALTGTPTAPTASVGTNTTQLATTAFVNTALDKKAKLISVSMSSSPYVYQDSDITENTYCMFNGTISVALTWVTASGSLTITADSVPSGGLTFDAILITPSTSA